MTVFEQISLFLNKCNHPKDRNKTSLVLWLVYFCWNTFRKVVSSIILAGYSSRTIATYFRKQGAHIGEDCDILVTQLGTEPYLVTLGNHVIISQGVDFHTHDGGVWVLREKIPGIRIHGPIVIEDNCIIGANTTLLPNIRIGRNSIVGAGSVVISNIPPNRIVMGVPARVIGSISKYEEKCLERWDEQKPPDLDITSDPQWARFKSNRQKVKKHLLKLFEDRLKITEQEEDDR